MERDFEGQEDVTGSAGATGAPAGEFDLQEFLPYLLAQAAEATSVAFNRDYRREFDLSRTQWRVLANLGKFGAMTAAGICRISHMEKTSVSRAVAELERRGLISRAPSRADRRAEELSLTAEGARVFAALGRRALAFDRALRTEIGERAAEDLARLLKRLAAKARR